MRFKPGLPMRLPHLLPVQQLILPLFTLLLITGPHYQVTGQTSFSQNGSSTVRSMERMERLTSFFDEYVEQERLAGGVIWVSKGDEVYHHAFGSRDREAGDPMETEDRFRIASQTNALISGGIMIRQGQCQL